LRSLKGVSEAVTAEPDSGQRASTSTGLRVDADSGVSRPSSGLAATSAPHGRSLRPTPWEWVLVAYLAAVCVVTILSAVLGDPVLQVFSTTAQEVAERGVWIILLSGLIVQGAVVPQILMTAALGTAAIRLAGGRVFWTAALVSHLLGTLLVYVGVWVVDAVTPGPVALASELDFGISLVWCAALGVLTGVGWWSSWRLPPWARYGLSFGPPIVIIAVTLGSDGLARYEHALAYALAVFVVFLCRRWASLGRRLQIRNMARSSNDRDQMPDSSERPV
jgi:hypothetical protein